MSVKSAAFLALIAMILVSALAIADFFQNAAGAIRGIIPAVAVFRSGIYTFASVALSVFLFTTYKKS